MHEWLSPVVMVKKKDGQLRFCVDYRRLNAITHKDVFPMSRIDDMLDQLSGKKIFTTLDAKLGYWQVPLEETSRSKTAFIASNKLYQFHVMPFGLSNAPATFQRVIQQILSGLGGSSPFCCAYIDDILVFQATLSSTCNTFNKCLKELDQQDCCCILRNASLLKVQQHT